MNREELIEAAWVKYRSENIEHNTPFAYHAFHAGAAVFEKAHAPTGHRAILIQEAREHADEWRRYDDTEELVGTLVEMANMLAAHDAEEPEWEYGNEMLLANQTVVHPASSETLAKAQAWLWPMYRRRKAGPWEPVKP